MSLSVEEAQRDSRQIPNSCFYGVVSVSDYEVVLDTGAGASVGMCLRHAAQLSCMWKRTVTFEHNERSVSVPAGSDTEDAMLLWEMAHEPECLVGTVHES